jgi:hypothetical protein
MRVENTLQVTSALRSSRKFVNSSLESLKEGQKRTYGTSELIGNSSGMVLMHPCTRFRTLGDHLWPTEATGDTSMEVFEVAQPMLPRRGCRTDSRFFSYRMLSLLDK